MPDAEDPYTLNHLVWYEATGFRRPYPGGTTVRPPTDFKYRLDAGPATSTTDTSHAPTIKSLSPTG